MEKIDYLKAYETRDRSADCLNLDHDDSRMTIYSGKEDVTNKVLSVFKDFGVTIEPVPYAGDVVYNLHGSIEDQGLWEDDIVNIASELASGVNRYGTKPDFYV